MAPTRELAKQEFFEHARGGKCIIFTQRKRDADNLAYALSRSHKCEALHGDISQQHRERALSGFQDGRFDVLVATDVAARGLDVPNVDLVIHYELPNNSEIFVHRSGRTGRAGKKGSAILIYSQDQARNVQMIQCDVGCRFTELPRIAVDSSSASMFSDTGSSGLAVVVLVVPGDLDMVVQQTEVEALVIQVLAVLVVLTVPVVLEGLVVQTVQAVLMVQTVRVVLEGLVVLIVQVAVQVVSEIVLVVLGALVGIILAGLEHLGKTVVSRGLEILTVQVVREGLVVLIFDQNEGEEPSDFTECWEATGGRKKQISWEQFISYFRVNDKRGMSQSGAQPSASF